MSVFITSTSSRRIDIALGNGLDIGAQTFDEYAHPVLELLFLPSEPCSNLSSCPRQRLIKLRIQSAQRTIELLILPRQRGSKFLTLLLDGPLEFRFLAVENSFEGPFVQFHGDRLYGSCKPATRRGS